MTRDQIAETTRERLALWSRSLRQESATPVLLVGSRHGAPNPGQPVLCAHESLNTGEVLLILRTLVRCLENGEVQHVYRDLEGRPLHGESADRIPPAKEGPMNTS